MGVLFLILPSSGAPISFLVLPLLLVLFSLFAVAFLFSYSMMLMLVPAALLLFTSLFMILPSFSLLSLDGANSSALGFELDFSFLNNASQLFDIASAILKCR